MVVVGIVVVAAAVVAGIALTRSGSASDDAGALRGTKVTVETVNAANAQTAADELAGPGRLSVFQGDPGTRQQAVLGRLIFDTTRLPHEGRYALFVIDNDSHQVVPSMFGVGPPGSDVARGWDGRYGQLARSYTWLEPLAPIDNGDGTSSDPGMALEFAAGAGGPITFAAYPPPDSLPITHPAQQLTIAIAYFDDGGSPHWVHRIPA